MRVLRQNKRLIVAIISALLAFVLVNSYVSEVKAQAEGAKNAAIKAYGGEVVEIACAKTDILAGEVLNDRNVALRSWSSALLPAGAITNLSDIIDQTAAMPIFASEPIIAAKLGVNNSELAVPEGKCAISLPAEDVLAVGGAVRADTLISIYAAGSARVELLAEGVQVLATSNSVQNEDANVLFSSNSKVKLAWVTVAVDPQLVSPLITAARSYTLYIVLSGSGVNLADIELNLNMQSNKTKPLANESDNETSMTFEEENYDAR